jgi:hypothetical protein
MACDGYNCSALMGNWYEERRAFKQPARMHREDKTARQDNDITFVTHDAVKPLARISRAHPWNTQGVIIDRGEKNFQSLPKYSYQKERLDHYYNKGDERPIVNTTTLAKNTTGEPNLQTFSSVNYPIIDEKNAHQILEKRDFPQNSTDFRSTLKKHPEGHNKFYDLTSYQSQNSKQPKIQPKTDFDNEVAKRNNRAGVRQDHKDREGLKMTSLLTGEQYRDFPDPQHNTSIQRAWVYGGENCLNAANEKLSKTLSDMKGHKTTDSIIARYQRDYSGLKGADITTSLPLENGEKGFFPK